MLAPVPDARERDVARVEWRGDQLRMELVDARANVIAERWLDAHGSCAELAELVAVVIASWESDVHPEYARPHTEQQPLPRVPPPPPPTKREARRSRARRSAYDVALGTSVSLAGTAAPAGMLALTWIPRGLGLGPRLFGVVEAPRRLDLGVGWARWGRWMGGAELDLRLPAGANPIDLHGGIVLGWLTVQGYGFTTSLSGHAFSPAVAAGGRYSWWISRSLAVWLDVSGLYWTRNQIVFGEPLGHERRIPELEGLVTFGLAFGSAITGR